MPTNEEIKSEIINVFTLMIKALVDNPYEVKVTYWAGDKTTVYEINVDSSDLGRVIGKKGAIIGSLRTLLVAISSKYKHRSILELIEKERDK